MKKQYSAPLKVELIDKKNVSWSKILNIVLALISLGFSMTAFFITQGFQQENRKIEQRYKEQENKKEFRTSPLYISYKLNDSVTKETHISVGDTGLSTSIKIHPITLTIRSGTILEMYTVNYLPKTKDIFSIQPLYTSSEFVTQTDIGKVTITPEGSNNLYETIGPESFVQMYIIKGTGDKNYLLMYAYDNKQDTSYIVDFLNSLSSESKYPRQVFLDIYQKTRAYLESKNIKLS